MANYGLINTDPATIYIAIAEELPIGFDTTNLLLSGESPSSPVMVLTDQSANGKVISLGSFTPSISGNIVTQVVSGSVLTVGHQYNLSLVFTANTNKTWEMILQINVPI